MSEVTNQSLCLEYYATMIKMRVYERNISVDSEADTSGDECTGTFEELLYHAEKEDRLTKGVFECAHVLETCPEIVMLCILPTSKSDNIGVHIQHTLIEAYCWENDIEVIKVDSNQFSRITKTQRSKSVDDTGCVLVNTKQFTEEMDNADVDPDDENFG